MSLKKLLERFKKMFEGKSAEDVFTLESLKEADKKSPMNEIILEYEKANDVHTVFMTPKERQEYMQGTLAATLVSNFFSYRHPIAMAFIKDEDEFISMGLIHSLILYCINPEHPALKHSWDEVKEMCLSEDVRKEVEGFKDIIGEMNGEG